jgi:hypothetical protein
MYDFVFNIGCLWQMLCVGWWMCACVSKLGFFVGWWDDCGWVMVLQMAYCV